MTLSLATSHDMWLVLYFVIQIFGTIFMVGKERAPISHGSAIFGVCIYVWLISLVVIQ